ncbi:hypothetical protein BC349_19685 [Flavihumibacter stibioxidans]|uniref:PH domain-containing protein n=2 Tax=Flavihumibacter stibioxidans TaxID=1834163 RepID=A0ABR7M6Q5_9BACT|nr:hypothetical protein [Flavihumibacter stibioxidans]
MLFIVTGILVVIVDTILRRADMPTIGVFVFLTLFIFIWIWLVFGELRTKLIKAEIEGEQIAVSKYLGFGSKKYYILSQFDGIETAILPSRYDKYEYLYLMKNGRKVIKLSEFYHGNYTDLKHALTGKVKNLGQSRLDFIQEVKEIFI